jgi:ferrochelatase
MVAAVDFRPVRTGVLLVNIGSPDEPRPGAVRRYLAEFLGDPRIVELPRWLWQPLLQGIILNTRAFRSARVYGRVWRAEGAPLVHWSRQIAARLQERLDVRHSGAVTVALAMRYGQPDMASVLAELQQAGIGRVLVLPLHPQYCATTVGSAFDGLGQALARQRWIPEIRFINGYHDHQGYIAALADAVRRHWRETGGRRHLVLSYHSIPVAYARRGDPYPTQVRRTSELLSQALGLESNQWSMGFQSRFMAGQWLEPSTEGTLTGLAAAGVKQVSIMSPVFPTDCLETLDDLVIRAADHFRRSGGETLDVIPALNDSSAHVDFLADLVGQHMAGWLPAVGTAPAPVIRLGRQP